MSYAQFLKAWFRYLPMNLSLPGLVKWSPLENAKSGYSVIIGCMNNMPEVVAANVAFISKMRLPNMHRLILVFDVEEKQIEYKEKILEIAGDLPVQILGYNSKQASVAGFFAWGWVYAWLSWTSGIAVTDTKYALIHDLDAMPIDPELFEDLYEAIKDTDYMFQGIRPYVGKYLPEGVEFVRTFEMIVDVQKLRRDFSPFEVFNKIRWTDGHYYLYDTFLHIQSRVKSCRLELKRGEDKLVHPSQLISQYTDLHKNRVTKGFWEKYGNLPLFPIYNFLGGNPELMDSITSHLESTKDPELPFEGKQVNFSGLPSGHWSWLWQQARTLQTAYYGNLNKEIENYIALMNATYNPS